MMNVNKMWITAALCMAMTVPLYAAANKPVDITADTIEYDAKSGQTVANGNVKMTQEDAVITGTKATYNAKSNVGEIDGGAHLVKGDLDMVCEKVTSLDQNHIVAFGDVVMKKAQNTLYGPKVDYFSDREYAIIESDARLVTPDGIITANQLESFMQENRAVATGNVQIHSDTKKLDATSDVANYYGAEGEQGRIVLTGNAVAMQDGNTLRGNTLTLFLDSKPRDTTDVKVQSE